MKHRLLVQNFSNLIVAALLTSAGLASAADIRVMISAGFHGVYAELAPAFEQASGHRLVTTCGPSMGDSSEAIPTRLARGEAEIGFQQVAELIHVSGINFVGPIPTEVQPTTFFSAALTQTAVQPEAAGELIRYLSLPPRLPYASHGLMTVTLAAA